MDRICINDEYQKSENERGRKIRLKTGEKEEKGKRVKTECQKRIVDADELI